jgi:arginine/ornithine transport system permease protein
VTSIFDLQGYGASLFQGSLITLGVALLSLVLALIFGMAAALAKLAKNPVLRTLATIYSGMVRGVPDLVLMLLCFFGGQVLINFVLEKLSYEGYVDINPFIAGVLTLGTIYGAYMCESFRGAILAVDKGEVEAAHSFGLSPRKVFRRIVFPQMLRHALPSLGNNWMVLLKGTAIVSVIGLDDLVRKASLASGATQSPFRFYFAVALAFLGFTSISIWFLKGLERHFNQGFQEARGV